MPSEMTPWNPKQINPALLTQEEYYKIVNHKNEWHDDSAYDLDMERLQSAVGNPSQEGFRLIRQFTIKGLSFRLMGRAEKIRYAQRNHGDKFNPWLRDESGNILYYTDAEIADLGLRPEEFDFRIYNEDDKVVAASQDEYSAMLIMTASEYRGFGFGAIIGKIARTYEPDKTSGGFTSAGAKNFTRVHREFVRNALSQGLYTKLVRSNQITIDRVKEIVSSAKIQLRPKRDNIDLSSNSPKSWMLYGDHHGTFILYDRKLATMIENERYEGFTDSMFRGMVYASADKGVTRIKQFGGVTPQIKSFMMALAYTISVEENSPLWVEPEEYDLPGFQYGEETNAIGYKSKKIIRGKKVDYAGMVEQERQFRKSFDRYDEFKYLMTEKAHSIFRMPEPPPRHRWT